MIILKFYSVILITLTLLVTLLGDEEKDFKFGILFLLTPLLIYLILS
jgi:hypothetical protein